LFEMSNGCVCCSVRGDLVRTLHELLARRGAFDCIVIETTGVANPGPVIQTFFIDHVLKARTILDSVTTVVDAGHIGLRLADSPAAAEQIAFADQIVLNKTELLTGGELEAIEAHLRKLNQFAPIHRARRAEVGAGSTNSWPAADRTSFAPREFSICAAKTGAWSFRAFTCCWKRIFRTNGGRRNPASAGSSSSAGTSAGRRSRRGSLPARWRDALDSHHPVALDAPGQPR
jgi:G3E family GTPase